jgi:hypothetical protein
MNKWYIGEIREYQPISGGCFMCIHENHYPCKFSRDKDEQKKVVELLVALSGDIKMEKYIELTADHLRQIVDYLDDPEDLSQMDIGYFTAEELVKLLNDELTSFVIQDPKEKE